MRVGWMERSRNGYHPYSERKHSDRLKRKTYSRNNEDDHHHHHPSRHHYHEDYPSNRTGNDQSSYSLTSRFDRHDIYPTLLNNQSILEGGPPPADIYYNSSQTSRERSLTSHYIDSERNRYSTSSSSTYRRENSPPSASYRTEVYSRDEYRSPVHSIDPYNEMYRTSDHPNRSERYDNQQNRNCSITSQPSPVYHSDPYQSSTSYVPRDQYIQSSAPMREADYRTRDYGTPTISYNSSDRYHSSSSSRNYSRSNLNKNRSNRPIRR